MYGQTIRFDLPVFSPTYAPILARAEITPTPGGLVFRFLGQDNDYVTGTITVRTDAGVVTEIELGTLVIDEMIEIGDWGFGHMRIGPGSTDTIADLDVDDETRDVLQGLLLSVMAYAQGHGSRITARLAPPTASIEP